MKNFMGMAVVFGLATMATGAFAQTTASPTASPTEAVKFDTCMSMQSQQRANDSGCKAVMEKMKVSNTDMDKMKSCESRPGVDVNKDSDCKTMMKKHPDLVRGHGREEPDADLNMPKPGNNGQPLPPGAPPAK